MMNLLVRQIAGPAEDYGSAGSTPKCATTVRRILGSDELRRASQLIRGERTPADGGSPGFLRCGMNVLLALGCLLAVLLCVAGILLRDVVRSRSLQRRGRSLGLSFEPVCEPVPGPSAESDIVPPGWVLHNCLQRVNRLCRRLPGSRLRSPRRKLRNSGFDHGCRLRSQTADLPSFELGLKGSWDELPKRFERVRQPTARKTFRISSSSAVRRTKSVFTIF